MSIITQGFESDEVLVRMTIEQDTPMLLSRVAGATDNSPPTMFPTKLRELADSFTNINSNLLNRSRIATDLSSDFTTNLQNSLIDVTELLTTAEDQSNIAFSTHLSVVIGAASKLWEE
jgi:hypothetical protein